MTIEGFSKLVDSIAKLISSIAWPSVTGFLLIKFGPDILRIIEEREDIGIKGPGFEATLKNKANAAATALVAARATSRNYSQRLDLAADAKLLAADAKLEASEVVTGSITPRFLSKAKRSTVLWVDDMPDNNVFERQALEDLGVRFVLATSTDEALDLVSRHKIDVIISDMGRPSDSRAGYTLLEELRAKGIKTPYIIYAGSRSPEHIAESRRNGAIGCTNDPYELFQYVVESLRLSA